MDRHAGPERLSLLHCGVPPEFERRLVTIAPGAELPFVEDDWRDALVVVEAGEIDVECSKGGSRRFVHGNVIWLAGLSLRVIRNLGTRPALLVAVSRKPINSGSPPRLNHHDPD